MFDLRFVSHRMLVPSLLTALSLAPAWAQQSAERPADPPSSEASEESGDSDEPKKTAHHYEITVTATRTEKDTFDVPNPVSVIGEAQIDAKRPDTVTDLLRELPGVDVNGVGPNQPRPIIRGQRGQRILLMADGIRLNNSRQTSDFGEIPGLVDVDGLSRVEVVRGPGSVLYGSDAIGGVINMIAHRPRWGSARSLGGSISYRYSSADAQSKADLRLSGHENDLGWVIGGSYRDARDYEAPNGEFGDIRLDDEVRVNDTSLRDENLYARFEYRLAEDSYVYLKGERYRSENAGFGWVDPSEYDSGSTATTEITYPFQDVDQYSIGYRGTNLGLSFADVVSATAYTRNNEREFDLLVTVPFFPGAGLIVNQTTTTDVETVGTRVEATKALSEAHVMTYGLDAFRDEAETATLARQEFFGLPVPPSVDDTPSLPRASYASYGLFIQDDWQVSDRFAAIVGLRGQSVDTETQRTPGLDFEPVDSTDSAVVWAANLIYQLSDNFRLIANVGTAFRSPNLTERFFNGPTPEGSGFQVRNPDLEPERSTNVDLGFKYRRNDVYCELTAYRNELRDGIAIRDITEPGGDPTFQNVNVDRLRYEGIELLFDWAFAPGFSVGLNYTYQDSKDLDSDADTGVTDSFSDKLNFSLRYRQPKGRYWVEYHVRHNGERDAIIIGEDNPLGDAYPEFTVHSIRSGFRIFRGERMTHRLGLSIENLFNELYAEFSNASFFRPEPKRSYIATWTVSFD